MNEETAMQRLRTAGLRPTPARVGVLAMLGERASSLASADEISRQLILRGMRVSAGTVYRAINELETRGFLQRQWDSSRKSFYGVKPEACDAAGLQLVCRRSGRVAPLADTRLAERLAAAIRREGFDVSGQVLTIYLDSMDDGTALPPAATFTASPPCVTRQIP